MMRAFSFRRTPACPLAVNRIIPVHPSPFTTSFQSRSGNLKPCLPSAPRGFQTLPALKDKWISSEIIVHECKHRKIEKWGWVFYRTTYKDDEAWDNFKQRLNFSVRSIISSDPRSEVNEAMFDKLQFVFVEDKAKFDGASKEELRSHFQEWVTKTFSSENPCAEKTLIYDDEPVPRYRFFFELDEDALRSCGATSLGHANFVDGFWGSSGQPGSRNMNSASEEDSKQLQDQREAVEGSSDAGWMRMNLAFLMDPHFYAGMSGSTEGLWRFFYERPPALVPNTKLSRLIQFQNMARRTPA
ncbi:hypothetical protein N7520_011213 [Penicillium odoratum]|uniref:uncharacterized protein n=1 Tax=Penicillium odoratum TaxID=1167516 RepID=UPI0025491A02|nr:uncharacterized protein N7520_011213 [Penicillium odoratum]KAJ5746031.1 hypothetical protein N7520_011213 [Penicillium odoratum]